MGCSKESNEMIDEVTPQNGSFSVLLNSSNTKTTNSGTSTHWVAGDAINMFHALAGGTSYINDGQFTTSSSGSTATFTGTLGTPLVEGNSYDWYAIYPYDEHITTPAPISSGYSVVGSTIDGVQTQTNKDNMSHIAGVGYPIVGRATSVSAETKPTILMSNATALLKVHVTNNSASTLTVSSVVFIASEKVVGQYFIDITGAKPTFTDKSSSTSRYARLAVSGTSKDITVGSSGDFYLAVKPFTVHDGDKLSVSVNGFQRTLTVGSDQEIAAGKIKTLNFDYNPPAYDQLFYTALGITGTGYQNWSDISGTYSSAIYSGSTNANDNNYIQLRTTSPSGIVTTTSGGYLNKVAVTWNSETVDGRKIFIYGSNSPYTSAADLYDSKTAGTKIGEITKGTDTEISASNYFSYIGIIASGGALYMDEIDIHWGLAKPKVSAPTGVTATATGTTINVGWTDVASNVGSYIVTCSGQTPQVISQGVQTAAFTSLPNDTYTVTVQAVPSDVSLASGSYSYSDVMTVPNVVVSGGVSEVWKLTPISDITASDVFVIVGKGSYAMTNNNGTSSAPATVAISSTTEGGVTKLVGTVADNIKWNLSKSGDDYTFYPNGDDANWLYCNTTATSSSNNNIRVGTGSRKSFVFNTNNHLVTDDTYTARYLSIYNNNDWRGYTSEGSAATITFYVLQ